MKPERVVSPIEPYEIDDLSLKVGFAAGWNECMGAWEQWEKEQTIRWVLAGCDLCSTLCYVCPNCDEFIDYDEKPLHAVCPGCGKKMEG